MSVKERDPLTGHQTTGHEWNGITELNTRVPRAVWFFIIITHIWAVALWFLLPAWPLVNTYTKGILGVDQQKEVQEDIVTAKMAKSDWLERIATMPVNDILNDQELVARVDATAYQLYGDNCAACHGQDAKGAKGFPNLVDDAWLWGGDTETIMETLRVGINSTHPDTRLGQMLAFGRDGMLQRDDIHAVVDYVQSLSGIQESSEITEAGKTVFSDNCASCHSENAEGMKEVGAPNLADDIWIYGSDDTTLFKTVWGGRQGWMPAWEGRMSETERKILAIYLQRKREGAVK